MMNIYENKIISCIVLDDKYGRINSHWAYSTEKLNIVSRIYYDEPDCEKIIEKVLKEYKIDVIAFSGRRAVEVARKLKQSYDLEFTVSANHYRSALKVMKLHNTNLSDVINADVPLDYRELQRKGNDWVKLAINHPFDVIFVQTHGDAEILNRYNQSKSAVWVPYSYNDRIYYDRKLKKSLDIGAFFKLERHPHRISFVKRIEDIAKKNGYSFEFSDQYWGKDYAKKLGEAKIAVHISYCGDIPWRLYECAASGTCLLTDPLKFGVEKLFAENCYVEYNADFSDLEKKIIQILSDDIYRQDIVNAAKLNVQKFAWGDFADYWIVPILSERIEEKRV